MGYSDKVNVLVGTGMVQSDAYCTLTKKAMGSILSRISGLPINVSADSSKDFGQRTNRRAFRLLFVT